jgi:RecB family exonuclease
VGAAPGVAPVADWSVPEALVSTKRAWSASALDKLLNCPLQWTLNYAAKVRPGDTAALPDLRTLSGTFGHALFEQYLFSPTTDWDTLSPAAARAGLGLLFDARVALEAAPLTLPENAGAARRLRQQLGDAAAGLVGILKAGGWRPSAPEKPVADFGTRFDGELLSGFVDLVVKDGEGNLAIIDLKLGGGGYRRSALKDGVAVQLALYAFAAAGGREPLPPVAFFILEDGELLTTDETAFPGATVIPGPSSSQTWLDAKRAWAWWSAAVRAGAVVARGEHLGEAEVLSVEARTGRPPPPGPWIHKQASCRYCDAKRLCTFRREGGEG